MTRLLDNLPPGGDFLSSMSKKSTSGRKRSSLGMGPFREHPIEALKTSTKPSTGVETTVPKVPKEGREAVEAKITGTKAVQMRNKSGTNAVHNGDKERTIGGTQSGTNAVQQYTPSDTTSLRSTRGNYRRVLLYVYAHCRRRGQRITSDICLSDLAQELQISYESVRTTLRRMFEKQFLKRSRYSTGRGGWVEYEIPESIYSTLLDMETSNVGWPEMRNICGTNGGSISGQNVPCSSSGKNLITTTTNDDQKQIAREQWLKELSAVDLKNWGIRKHALLEYVGEGKLCEDRKELEEFLHRAQAAIEDLRKRGQTVRSPAGFLMHCLREGYVGVPEGYKSIEEEKLEQMNREQRQKLENIKAAKKEKYQIEYEIFKETVDQGKRASLMKEIENTLDVNRGIVGNSAYEMTLGAKLEECMKDLFVKQYEPTELRGEVLNYLS